jgi:hypothetical protein
VKDAVGNEIRVGDFVRVTQWDSPRGAHKNTLHQTSPVVGFGRTRVVIQVPSLNVPSPVGPECVIVMAAVDSRPLLSWSDVHGGKS